MNTVHDDDIELVENFRDGDKSSLEKLYIKYKRYLLRIIWYYMNNMEDVEDVLQDLFLKLMDGLKRYRVLAGATFKTWLFRVAVNTAKDHLRKKKQGIPVADIERYEDKGPGWLEQMEKKELLEEVRKQVFRLPLKYREVVVMVFFEDLKYEEVAQILRKPVGTIKSRSHFALNLLRQRMGERTK
ncbi:MAG: RNA polymerase sigma factor [bacterium]|nr:RNA polymerase sigma factor [bacterium]